MNAAKQNWKKKCGALFAVSVLLLSGCVMHKIARTTGHIQKIQTTALVVKTNERLAKHVKFRAKLMECDKTRIDKTREGFIYWTCFNK